LTAAEELALQAGPNPGGLQRYLFDLPITTNGRGMMTVTSVPAATMVIYLISPAKFVANFTEIPSRQF